MSGIPVYTSSPISAAKKPSGVTPQTSALPFPLPASQASNPPDPSAPNPPPANSNSILNPNPTLTTTSTASYSSSYQPAKPGTAAFPTPTAIPVSPATTQRYVPFQPTPTTQGETAGPPAPQPGAFPTPVKSIIPPPPKVGESYNPQQSPAPPIPGAIAQPLYPPQMSIPPPTSALGSQQPRSSTSTAQAASSSYRPVQLPSSEDGAPRRSLEHPPGYQQNVYASDLTSEQRRAMEANASRENLERMMGGEQGGEGVWNTLGKMAQQAGAKIAETEASVWRSINKE